MGAEFSFHWLMISSIETINLPTDGIKRRLSELNKRQTTRGGLPFPIGGRGKIVDVEYFMVFGVLGVFASRQHLRMVEKKPNFLFS